MPEPTPTNLADSMNSLEPKTKAPASARVLNAWIAQAQTRLETAGPRLGWLVAATVTSAALQRAVDEHGEPLFLLKGGTMLQYRLPGMSRTTKDIDGLVRGDLGEFLFALDTALAEPWGPLTLTRDEVEVIKVPNRIANPRRFDIIVALNGVTWRRVQVEISPDEGQAGTSAERIAAPSLSGFGLPSPDHLTSLSMAYQIAQKIHACTDPHNPPELLNDRARDVVDLLLLRDLINATQNPTLSDVRAAIKDVFTARATEASAAEGPTRSWPTRAIAYTHWETSYSKSASSAGVTVNLREAISQLNTWFSLIEHGA